MKIIGISGYKQGGKSSLAEFIRINIESKDDTYDVLLISFADALKYAVLDMFVPAKWEWTIDDLDSNKNKNLPTTNKTVREMLQWLGTDICRKEYEDVWVNALENQILRLTPHFADNVFFIIPDVRFPNEVKFIQDKGGKVLRLTRRPFPDDCHESETALDDMQSISMIDSDPRNPVTIPMEGFDCIIGNCKMTEQEKNEAALPIIKEWLK